ncbi:MAG: NAD(P)H-hydrate dehydratase, partial [Bacteroidales bacterium]
MKVFPVSQIKVIDARTIELEPVASIDLMERAAESCTGWIVTRFPHTRPVVVFAGPGNNGGDGLAIARQLRRFGYEVTVYLPELGGGYSVDFKKNLDQLKGVEGVIIRSLQEKAPLPEINSNSIVLDAIFGSGLNRPASGLAAQVIRHINQCGRDVISIDLPSGLFGDDNTDNNPEYIVRARYTLSFQFPKLAFFFASNAVFTGDWHVLDIRLHPDAIRNTPANTFYLQQEDLRSMLRPRPRFSHKGTFGHALLIAGSEGMMGAAVLSTRACVRSGAGLVTIHAPKGYGNLMHAACPEALVSADVSTTQFTAPPALDSFTSTGVGPGLGRRNDTVKGLELLLKACKLPLVLDADALNIISGNPELLQIIPAGSILTPHPGEFDRLFGPTANDYARWKLQIKMAEKLGIYILLKGAYSSVASPDGTSWFNSTGNPGMATGGSGDVLTGLITGLLASHHTPLQAALLGMWLHGKAGDLAAENTGGDALTAGDL